MHTASGLLPYEEFVLLAVLQRLLRQQRGREALHLAFLVPVRPLHLLLPAQSLRLLLRLLQTAR